jgi:phenylpyruvate tautomerase PptA (4-oxalocrotonate tautomerase family)
MPHFVRAGAFVVVAFTVAVAIAEDKKPDDKKEEKKGEVLKTVIDVTYDFDKEKKALTVIAVGQVPTGGWKDAKLVRRETKDAPADGIYEYELTAVRPTGIVPQIVSKVKASHTWENPPSDIKGVKVYGVGDGAKTIKFDK